MIRQALERRGLTCVASGAFDFALVLWTAQSVDDVSVSRDAHDAASQSKLLQVVVGDQAVGDRRNIFRLPTGSAEEIDLLAQWVSGAVLLIQTGIGSIRKEYGPHLAPRPQAAKITDVSADADQPLPRFARDVFCRIE